MQELDQLIKQEQMELKGEREKKEKEDGKIYNIRGNVDVDELRKMISGRVTNFMSQKQTNCGRNAPTIQSQQKYACVFEKRGEFNQAKIGTANRIQKIQNLRKIMAGGTYLPPKQL